MDEYTIIYFNSTSFGRYSTCHWCHVMERESFENEEVAAVMNRHFVNIKVDCSPSHNIQYFQLSG